MRVEAVLLPCSLMLLDEYKMACRGSTVNTNSLPTRRFVQVTTETGLRSQIWTSDLRVTQELYDSRATEEDRKLELHPLEYQLTIDALAKYLPLIASQSITDDAGPAQAAGSTTTSTAPARRRKIADIGGATGTYAFFLAGRGEEVHLRDLSPALLEIATARNAMGVQGDKFDLGKGTHGNLASIQVGNAIDASTLFAPRDTGTFDAVLLLGPLYHLIEAEERQKALQNALDLLKPSGLLFAAFVSQNAHLRDIARRDPSRLVREKNFYETYLQTGKYVRRGDRNAVSYHSRLSEIPPLVQGAGGRVIEIIGIEGILGGGLDKGLVGASQDVVESWVNVMKPLGRQQENLGNADHWLVVIERATNQA